MPKNNRNRKGKSGWVDTRKRPHKQHPANYKRKTVNDDNVKYLTFTHSSAVETVINGKKYVVHTIPLTDNISIKERAENRRKGLKPGENRSYVFPLVYNGSRSSLGKNNDDYSPVLADKIIIDTLFLSLPEMTTPIGKGIDKKITKKKPRK